MESEETLELFKSFAVENVPLPSPRRVVTVAEISFLTLPSVPIAELQRISGVTAADVDDVSEEKTTFRR